MAIDYDKIMALPPIRTRHVFTRRDTILYALGVGAASAGLDDPNELQFVYEENLQALPTMAVVLGYPGLWLKNPEYGVDWRRLVHGEQSIRIHRPLPIEGDVTGITTVNAIYDKGPQKGAVVYVTREIKDSVTDELIASLGIASFLRSDGGFGGSSVGAPKPHPTPSDRACDEAIEYVIRPDQAMLYRLSGDWNPLHIDPVIAREAGFAAPILQGLCTYGFVGRAVLKALCGGSANRLKRVDVRFSSPVFPGETLRVEIWREGPGRAALRVRVVQRDVIVLQNGFVEFDP
jgi:acyl dehydratase